MDHTWRLVRNRRLFCIYKQDKVHCRRSKNRCPRPGSSVPHSFLLNLFYIVELFPVKNMHEIFVADPRGRDRIVVGPMKSVPITIKL